jgi:phosphatidylethanolamine-binding protein (PEBP) family uncharacterized protein
MTTQRHQQGAHVRRHPTTIPGTLLATLALTLALALALALAGCGTSSEIDTTPHIAVKSAALTGDTMPALYTCHGHNTPPTIEWGNVPSDVKELALFLVSYTSEPLTHTNKISVEWSVAGIDPNLHKLQAGKLPHGAYFGLNSNGKPGYSVCPEKGKRVQYQFELYGVPTSITTFPQFAAIQLVTTLANPNNHTHANAYGAIPAIYKG